MDVGFGMFGQGAEGKRSTCFLPASRKYDYANELSLFNHKSASENSRDLLLGEPIKNLPLTSNKEKMLQGQFEMTTVGATD